MVTDIAWGRSVEIFNEDSVTVWEFFCLCDAQAAGFTQTSYFQDSWTLGCSTV